MNALQYAKKNDPKNNGLIKLLEDAMATAKTKKINKIINGALASNEDPIEQPVQLITPQTTRNNLRNL